MSVDFEKDKPEKGGKGEKGKGGGKGDKDSFMLFFKSVPLETTYGFLLGKFKKYGYVKELSLWSRPDGSFNGMGTVSYGHPAQVEDCINDFNGQDVDGRRIVISPYDGSKDDGFMGGKGREPGGMGFKGEGKSGKRGATNGGTCVLFFKSVPFETSAGFLAKKFQRYGRADLDLWKNSHGESKGMGT